MPTLPRVPFKTAWLIAGALALAVVGARALTPRLTYVSDPPSLQDTVPRAFGDWKEVVSPYVQVDLAARRDGEPSMTQPYDETVMRAYRDSKGHQVMLALAYGERQRQEVKVHRPDLCYSSQGYSVDSMQPTVFDRIHGAGSAVQGNLMLASSRGRTEAVAYWIRIGGLYSENAWQTRTYILKEGLAGRVPDGILVRASTIVDGPNEAKAAYPVLKQFLSDLVEATPAATSALMVR